MNFMYTSKTPRQIALDHCLIHRNSQIKEHCQMMSTAHNVTRSGLKGIYATTHQFHPSCVWIRKSLENYQFMWETTKILCELHRDYSGNDHGCEPLVDKLKQAPSSLSSNGFSEPPVAAPDRFKLLVKSNSVAFAYQRYLNWKFREWARRSDPIFVVFEQQPKWFVPSKLWLRR